MQNMILVVGPSTPAALASLAERRRRSRHSHQDDDDDDDVSGVHLHDDTSSSDDDDDSSANGLEQETTTESQRIQNEESQDEEAEEETSQVSMEDDDASSEEAADDVNSESAETASILSAMDTTNTYRAPTASQRSWVPLIRHESCINTACWLDVPWRLSVNSDKLPTRPIERTGDDSTENYDKKIKLCRPTVVHISSHIS